MKLPNAHLAVVEQAKIGLGFRTDKAVYSPGETVVVDVTTALGGKPVPAEVTVGVVDEMIYVLQPEIAPSIDDGCRSVIARTTPSAMKSRINIDDHCIA